MPSGTFLRKLVAPDAQAVTEFGASVALYGDRCLVGAPLEWSVETDAGAAYLFDVTTGMEIVKLVSPEPEQADFFGSSVALNDRFLVVHSRRSVHVFDAAGNFRYTIEPYFASLNFGLGLRLRGDLLLVGDTWKESAYLYHVPTGEVLASYSAPGGEVGDDFGRALDFGRDHALFGAWSASTEQAADSGAVYAAHLTTGAPLLRYVAPDVATEDWPTGPRATPSSSGRPTPTASRRMPARPTSSVRAPSGRPTAAPRA